MQNINRLPQAEYALSEEYLHGIFPDTASAVTNISSRPLAEPVPLSFEQKQLWLLTQLIPNSPILNESLTIRFIGALNVTALEQSLNEFINRHEIWRTSFLTVDGHPVQRIHPSSNVKLSVMDVRNFPETKRESEALRLATENAMLPFDLAHYPLLRVLLIRQGDEDYRLFMTLHHMIADIISIYQVFLPEFSILYEAFSSGRPSPLSPLPTQYADFAAWERKSLQEDTLAEHLTYWKQQLADAPPVLDLPTDRPRPPLQSYHGSIRSFTLSSHLTEALKAFSRQEGVPLDTMLKAAFQVLLYRYSGQDDLLLGTITSCCKRPEGLMGYFLNTEVLRTNMSNNPSFVELLRQVHDVIISNSRHDVPFDHIVEGLHPVRNLSYHPLTQVTLSYRYQLPTLPSGWTVSQTDIQTHTSKFDLCLELDDRPEGLTGRFIYNTDLFDDSTIRRMAEHWQILLEGIIADPSQRLTELPLFRQEGRHLLQVEWNDTAIDYPQDQCIHQLFEAQVEQTPDAVIVMPLSTTQQGLWRITQSSEPDSVAYNLPVTINLRGLLDVSVLERSLNAIVQRNGVLRTTFRMIDGLPMQVIAPTLIVPLPVADLRDLPEAERDAQVSQLMREVAFEPFNLARGPLMRTTLLRLNEDEHVLLLTAHRMVFDDWSTNVFMRELAVLYESFSLGRPSSLPDLTIQYADYVWQQREQVQGDVLAKQLSYWKLQLSGAPVILQLPTDRPRPAVQTFEAAQQSLVLPQTLTEALQTLSQQEGVTPFMSLLAAFHILLQRYTGQEDLVVGLSIANRTQKEIEELIGCFASTLALRSNLSGNPNFRELLARVREASLEAYAHIDLPSEQLVEDLQPQRNLNRLSVFDVMVNFIDTPPTIWELPGLTISSVQMVEPIARFAMTMYVEAWESDLSLRLVYQSMLFSPERIACILDQFQYLLEQIVAAPEKPIQLYSLVTPESVHLLPNPSTVLSEPQYEVITHLFTSWVSRAPKQIAVCQDHRTWTYQELSESACAIAQSLLAQGHKQGDVVAVIGQQSFGLIASMMAAFFSGGVLLPIDRGLPTHRQQLMLREAGAKHLLYIGNWRPEDEWLQELPCPTTLCVWPDKGQVVEPKSTSDVQAAQLPALSSNDAAYIFFTSGTTGVPKGVLGCHKGLSHFLNWERETFAVGPHDRCAQLTGLSFDVVLRDIFLPLTSGATLCLPEWSDEPGLDKVLLWLEREKISLLHTVPALAQSWLANNPSEVSLRSLRWVFFAGEPLTDMLVHRWRAAFPEAGGIANFYGPTETSLAKCCYMVDADTVPGIQPVGWPLLETQALVLTESNQLCGIGEIGEIVLRTPFHSLGYINAPEENRKRFTKNPFRNDERDLLYRTGDRGRYRLDGSLEILGRLDHQIKIRGVRVEPDEVMATLLLHPAVKSCVVVAQKNEQGQNSLVAYVAIAKQEHVTSSELRSYLSRQLPSPMVPSAFVLLEALPLTPNGKIDRRALPAPDFSHSAQDFVAASTPLQKMVAASWSQALGIEQISIHDNFFSLGGHSLLAMQVSAHLRITLQVELSLRSFFDAPTIVQQAEYIAQLRADEMAPSLLPTIGAVSRESYRQPVSSLTVGKNEERADEVVIMPISLQQRGLWLVNQLEPDDPAYNLPIMLRLQKRLDLAALEQSLQVLVERHESLRTTFMLIGDQPMQVIATWMPVSLNVVDLGTFSDEQQEVEVQRLLAQEMQQPFDLVRGPLLRTSVLQLGAEEHLVLLLMHHIISDGWSVGVISRELTELYEAHVTARPAQLAALPLQYADFALWQREWLQGERLDEQLAYWKEALAGAPPVLALPTDHPRPTLPTHRGAGYTFTLSQSLSEGLKHLSRQEGVTLYMTLVAGFVALLQRYTGQDDVAIGTTVAGRIQQETKDLIGYFVNTLVLRTNLGGNPDVREILGRVREAVLGAYAHQQVPFEWLTKELKPERSLNLHPLFQVLLTFDPPLPTLASKWEYAQVKIPTVASKFDLSLTLSEQEGTLEGYLEYSAELFEEATIVRLMTHWQQLLEVMVANPQQPVAQLSLLTPREREQLLREWNTTEQSSPQKWVPQLFEEQVERTPEAIALVFERQHMTYRELNRRANQLAHCLQELGVGPEVMIGVCVERSPEMIVSLLAILKAGGVYVPLDPEAPVQRLAFQMQETQMPVLLTQQCLLSHLPQQPVHLLCLDRDWPRIARHSSTNPIRQGTAEQLAYVIYTSGSTGQPKGVLIEHRALAAHCWSMAQVYELRAEDHVLQFSATIFDASLEQILPTLLVGARLVLRGPELWSPSQLLHQIQEQHVSVINLPPAYWQQVSQEWRQSAEEGHSYPLRLVIVGGDRLLPEALRTWRQTAFRSVCVLNAYGPTETTITATLYDTTGYTDGKAGFESVPIGRPVPNRTIYLLDRAGHLVPVGVVGELHIGGELLARGYLRRPDLTAERFVADPFSGQPGARLYKTGDLARYLPDGTIEMIGRVDQQVKIRGFRIELGEIEAVLSRHHAVREVAVVAREDRPGEKVLVAYVVARPGHHLQSQQLRHYLQEQLPSYMLPAAYVELEALPLLSTGKLDRHALPVPEYTQSIDSKLKEDLRTPLEEIVAQAWSQALGIESIGIHENFFALGGHSLLAMQVALQLQTTTHVELPLRSFFEAPTIAQIAKVIAQLQSQGAAPKMPALGAFSREAYRISAQFASQNKKG